MKGKPISGLQNFPRDIGHITIQNAMEFPDRSLIAALPVPANTGIINGCILYRKQPIVTLSRYREMKLMKFPI